MHSGDRMTRQEFHRIYEQMPEEFKAELIGGVVYVASPLRLRHGTNHFPLGTLLFTYEAATPGVQSGDNVTILLSDESEPQPDAFLRILPEFGGRTQTSSDDYIVGGPELVVEIAHSSRSIDLYSKREDYARNHVCEYLVVSLSDQRLYWFNLIDDQQNQTPVDGIYRIRSFPGLWIDGSALFAKDHARLITVLQQGLATPEHADFVARLAAAKR